MNRKILASLLVIGTVGALAAGSTVALFNDTATSSGNTFQAGSFDLQIEWTETYNGEVIEEQGLTNDPGPIFSLEDIKPGDSGTAQIGLNIFDNPGFVWMNATQTAGDGNDLEDNLYFTIWRDANEDSEFDENEEVYFNGTAAELDQADLEDVLIDGEPDESGVQPISGSSTEYVGVQWWVPIETGNEIQDDTKEFEFSFYAEQARHNNVTDETPEAEVAEENVTELEENVTKNVTVPEVEVEEPRKKNVTEPVEQNVTVNETVDIEVMKHICDEDIQSREEFDNVDGPDEGNTTEFHDKVLACPTVVMPEDNYTNGTFHFDEKRDFDFEVEGADGEVQDIEDAIFEQRQVEESDIGVDVTGDGDTNESLDTSLYIYENVSSGNVTVTETDAPEDTRPGALEFTPDALMENDDNSTLLEDLETVFADDDSVELDTTRDEEDNTITLHVYNFQDVENDTNVTPPDNDTNVTPPDNDTNVTPPDNDTNETLAAISFIAFCQENGEDSPGQGMSAVCPEGESELVRFEWDGTEFLPEEGDDMGVNVTVTEFKEANEPIRVAWESAQEISSVVVGSAGETCTFPGNSNGTVESCGPPPGQQ